MKTFEEAVEMLNAGKSAAEVYTQLVKVSRFKKLLPTLKAIGTSVQAKISNEFGSLEKRNIVTLELMPVLGKRKDYEEKKQDTNPALTKKDFWAAFKKPV